MQVQYYWFSIIEMRWTVDIQVVNSNYHTHTHSHNMYIQSYKEILNKFNNMYIVYKLLLKFKTRFQLVNGIERILVITEIIIMLHLTHTL